MVQMCVKAVCSQLGKTAHIHISEYPNFENEPRTKFYLRDFFDIHCSRFPLINTCVGFNSTMKPSCVDVFLCEMNRIKDPHLS